MTSLRTPGLTGRLSAGLVVVTLSAASALIGAGPAFAQSTEVTEPHPVISGVASCNETLGEWEISWTITSSESDTAGVINFVELDPDTAIDDILGGKTLPASQDGSIEVRQVSVPGDTAQATFTVEVRWGEGDDEFFTSGQGVVTFDGTCEEQTPAPTISAAIAVSCDLLVLAVRNEAAEFGVTLGLVASQDTVAGSVASAEDLLGQEPSVSLPDGVASVALPASTELADPQPVDAGELAGVREPLGVGEAAAHGIEISAGTTVDLGIGIFEDDAGHAEPGLTATIAWDDIADALDCPAEPGGGTGGGGGELPITGSTAPLLAGAAVILLAIGGGLYLAARRRRIQIIG